jgi:phage terminase large subunit
VAIATAEAVVITPLERMIQTAHDAGCPRDQVERFLQAGYVPLVPAWGLHAAARQKDIRGTEILETSIIGFGGSRGGGKSHASMAQMGIDDCQRVPGLRCLFLRKVKKSAAESFDELITKLFQNVRHVYTPSGDKVIIGDSQIMLGGYANASDIEKYIGINYETICIEEMNQLPEEKIRKIRGSLRTSRPGWVPRLYSTFNPGGVGHKYVKSELITPWREHRERQNRFIPSSYKDNPYLNPEYVAYLEALPGELGKAWRDGDWDSFEGMALPLFNYLKHVINPFDIPSGWAKWRAIDWGSAKPFTCGWFTRNPDNGRIFVYRQIRGIGMTDVQQARAILDATPPDENISTTFADPAMWTKNRQDEVQMYSTADIYAKEGVILTKANNNRIQGKRNVERLLADLPDGKPAIQFFSNCRSIIETLPALECDEFNPEDVDTDGDDHDYDALRYGLSNIRPPAPPPQKPKVNPIWNIKGL